MSFFDLSDSNEKLPTGGEFETGGGDMEPIPKNTTVLAVADEAKWDDYEGEEYISLRWVVVQPADYKNRKVFQKIKVNAPDAKKADKAKRMLAAIDSNAGGKLVASGEMPTNETLTMYLTQKPMLLKLQVWEINGDDGNKKRGNWISAVSPRAKGQEVPEPVAQPATQPATQPDAAEDFDDSDIPF